MKGRKRLWLLTAAAILWIGFIWGQSLIPAELSSQESGTVLLLLERVLHALRLPGTLTDHLVRKAAHFTEYLILGIMLTAALGGWGGARGLLLLPAAAALIPLVDETIQLFSPGRGSQIPDVWLDLFGFAAGAFLAALPAVLRRLARKGGGGNGFSKTE